MIRDASNAMQYCDESIRHVATIANLFMLYQRRHLGAGQMLCWYPSFNEKESRVEAEDLSEPADRSGL